MRVSSSKIALLVSLITLSACSSGSDIASELPSFPSGASAFSAPSAADQQVNEAIPQILSGIQDIRQELRSIRAGGGASSYAAQPAAYSPATAPSTTTTAIDPTTATPTVPSAPTTATAPAPATAAPAAPAKPDGTAELLQVMNKVRNAPYVVVSAQKIERNSQDGSSLSTTGFKMTMQSPNTVLAEITASSKSPDKVGTRVLYTSGQGDKAKVRPSGGLSFITTDLAKNDDRLTSTNKYTPDQFDLVGLHTRMAKGYEAELVGRTTVAGAKINVLRVTTTSTNTMGSFVTHEHIGYEPDSYKIRLWEMYSSSSKSPFYRMTIESIEFPASLPADGMKL